MVLWDWELCSLNKLRTHSDEEQSGLDCLFQPSEHAHRPEESSSLGLPNQIVEAQNNDFLDSLSISTK